LAGHIGQLTQAKEAILAAAKNPAALGAQILQQYAGVINRDPQTQEGRWNAVVYAFLKTGIQKVQAELQQIEAAQNTPRSPNSSTPAPSAVNNPTPARKQVQTNQAALQTLMRQGLLAQAVGTSSLVSTVEYEATITLRNSLVSALDAQMRLASDSCYPALSNARNAVWQDLTERARNSARLSSYTPPETLPALVLAYDYYTDANRADEIMLRNRVRHPGFVPPIALRVMTR
jgi:prophage DNA circulation protein